MANIELVIKIPKEQYNAIKSNLYNTFPAEMKEWGLEAIRNGTPLPKGHGRLIDADALNTRMEQRMDRIGDDESIWEASNVKTALDILAPTIIEADKAESEEI